MLKFAYGYDRSSLEDDKPVGDNRTSSSELLSSYTVVSYIPGIVFFTFQVLIIISLYHYNI
jgi:hypothetical protein